MISDFRAILWVGWQDQLEARPVSRGMLTPSLCLARNTPARLLTPELGLGDSDAADARPALQTFYVLLIDALRDLASATTHTK